MADPVSGAPDTPDSTQLRAEADRSTPYGWYVLGVLVIVYVFNFIDRQILTILADDLKRDLKIDDSDFGFLYGTAFGVFYSLFGIPLGKLADSWSRVKLMSIGLAVWSAMTAASGLARSFTGLAAARIGVGVGEATASPCAYSLISDYFPPRQRATALSIYSAGLYVGGGLSLFIGGSVVGAWNKAYPVAAEAPLGLVGWQAAFMAVGIPGLLLALWVATLREPLRGRYDGIAAGITDRPFAGFLEELVQIIPPLTLIGAARRGMAALLVNVAVAAFLAVAAWLLIRWTGDDKQWIAVAIGVYAVFSWASNLRRKDPPTFALIWGSVPFISVVVGYGLIAFSAYAVSGFAPLYAMQTFGGDKASVGFLIGGAGALGGALGVIGGGALADWLDKRHGAGRITVVLGGLLLPIIPFVISFTTRNETLYYALHLPLVALSSMALGASAATVVNLVLPRMRGTATATFFLGTTLIGLSLGPYFAGKMSVVTASLGEGMLWLMVAVPLSLTALIIAYRTVPAAAATVVERARAAGEPI